LLANDLRRFMIPSDWWGQVRGSGNGVDFGSDWVRFQPKSDPLMKVRCG